MAEKKRHCEERSDEAVSAPGDQKIVPADEWSHFAVTWKEGDGTVHVNGEEVGKIQGQVPTSWRQEQIFIGKSWNNEMLKGLIDEVGIFNIVLTSDDISTIMREGLQVTVASVSPAGNLATTWGKVKIQY